MTVFLARWLPHPLLRLLVVVGFLGGYTTFSSFSAEALLLWERGERWPCIGGVVGSVGAGLVAIVLGTMLGRGLIESATAWSSSRACGWCVIEKRRETRGDRLRTTSWRC